MKKIRFFVLYCTVIFFTVPLYPADILAVFKENSDIRRWFTGKKTAFGLAPWPDGTPGLSGKVIFKKSSSKECYPQISLFFKPAVSWSRYRYLRFNLFVENHYRGKICIVSADNKAFGNYFNADFSSGWHTVEIDLDKMKKHNVDLEQISRLIIFTGDPPSDMIFHIGALELIPRAAAAVRKEFDSLFAEFKRIAPATANKTFAAVAGKKEISPADCMLMVIIEMERDNWANDYFATTFVVFVE